jgi:hypothetical protein
MYDFQEQLANEMLMYELDMERMHEDESFWIDEVNAELQAAAQELQAADIEQAYDEMLASWMRMCITTDLI